jgi:hypothetical protein
MVCEVVLSRQPPADEAACDALQRNGGRRTTRHLVDTPPQKAAARSLDQLDGMLHAAALALCARDKAAAAALNRRGGARLP